MKKILLTTALAVYSFCSYAGTVVPGTEKTVTENLTVKAISDLTASITLTDDLFAGPHADRDVLGTATANVPGNSPFALVGDFTADDYDNDRFSWSIKGTNSPTNKLKVVISEENQIDWGNFKGDGRNWRAYNSGTKVNILLDGAQNIAPDVYPVTVNFARYEN